jgi:hypothetical protein
MRQRLAHLLMRAYPQRWRHRYGSEYTALLEELPADPRTVINVLAAGTGERLRLPKGRSPAFIGSGSGGPIMTFDLGGWHARLFAVVALFVTAPLAFFLGLNALGYNLNLAGPLSLAETLRPLLDNKAVGLYLMGAPALAFLIALVPILRFTIGRNQGELFLNFGVRGRVLNLIALAFSLLLVAFWSWHAMAEYLFGT